MQRKVEKIVLKMATENTVLCMSDFLGSNDSKMNKN